MKANQKGGALAWVIIIVAIIIITGGVYVFIKNNSAVSITENQNQVSATSATSSSAVTTPLLIQPIIFKGTVVGWSQSITDVGGDMVLSNGTNYADVSIDHAEAGWLTGFFSNVQKGDTVEIEGINEGSTTLQYLADMNAVIPGVGATSIAPTVLIDLSNSNSVTLVGSGSSSDWKTYTDSTYGFSFSYPANASISSCVDSSTDYCEKVSFGSSSIDIFDDSGYAGATGMGTGDHLVSQMILANGTTYTADGVISETDDQISLFAHFHLATSSSLGVTYTINTPALTVDNEYRDTLSLFQQMLSTFKFTN